MADIQVLDQNPLYLNQIYRLKFRFPPTYPIGMCCPLGGLGLPPRILIGRPY